MRIGSAALSVALIGIAGLACNAITGTGKYEVVDCPQGSACEGGASAADAQTVDGATTDAGGGGSDAAPEPLPSCGQGRGALRLTVTGTGGAVSGGGFSVAAGNTQTACVPADTLELRTSGAKAAWTGVSCKDGNSSSDRCEFDVSSSGDIVTAALP